MNDEEPYYKLIHSVDPTKKRIPIQDKFAKLTLSSNKKKQDAEKAAQKVDELQMEKRKSASRNLDFSISRSEQLFNFSPSSTMKNREGESAIVSDNHNKLREDYVNPLFQSDSSSDDGSDKFYDTQCEPGVLNETDFMNPLQMETSNDVEVENQIDIISQRVSIMGVTDTNVKSPLKNIKLEPPDQSINISSTTEEEDEEDDCSAITISSSSITSNTDLPIDYELATSELPGTGEEIKHLLPNTLSNDKADLLQAFLLDVSQQRREMQHNLQQQDTVINTEFSEVTNMADKDKEKATLLAYADTESMSLIESDFGNVRKTEIVEKRDTVINTEFSEVTNMAEKEKEKATLLAYADTESVSLIESDFGNIRKTEIVEKREKRFMALDDTVAMSQSSNASAIFGKTSSEEWSQSAEKENSTSPFPLRRNDNNSRNLAYADTEVNTIILDEDDNVDDDERNNSPRKTEQSVFLNETSDSILNSSIVDIPKAENVEDSLYISETSDEECESSAPSSSQIQVNISAKINIKIQINQPDTSDEVEDHQKDHNSDDDDGDDDDIRQEAQRRRMPSLLPSAENNENETPQGENNQSEENAKNHSNDQNDKESDNESEEDEQVRNTSGATGVDNTEQFEVEITEKEVEEKDNYDDDNDHDRKFMTDAEKLLNEIYGNSWQTPDAIKALKRVTIRDEFKAPTTCPSKRVTAAMKLNFEQPRKEITKTAEKKGRSSPTKIANCVEESVLDDFSMFQRNIVKTNLDSTRLNTSQQKMPDNDKREQQMQNIVQHANTEPRRTKRPQYLAETEFKIPLDKPSQRKLGDRACSRIASERCRQLLNNENDDDDVGLNASDDEDVDATVASDGLTDESASSEGETPTPARNNTTKTKGRSRKKNDCKDELVYLDLTKDEIEIVDSLESPPANHDPNFNKHLEEILRTCRFNDRRPKLPAMPNEDCIKRTKRKLFTPNFGFEEEIPPAEENVAQKDPKPKQILTVEEELVEDLDILHLRGQIFAPPYLVKNKPLDSLQHPTGVKNQSPILLLNTPKRNIPKNNENETPKTIYPLKTNNYDTVKLTEKLRFTPDYKCGFLKSLDVRVSKNHCDPDALTYRENYRQKKEELATVLYDLYNKDLFDMKLDVPLVWNKKLLNTAGRCLNKKQKGIRTSKVELSEKVLTSADRLRCTLVHELCHAATWILNGENGHGATWKAWARKANEVFPELPKIAVCHQYDIEYKYTYKCTLCGAKSHAHSKSKKVEKIRCAFCHGSIEIFLNKKDKDGNVMPTPVREATGFAKFVKDNYKQYKSSDIKHADVMKILSNKFAALKVAGNGN